MKRNIYHNFGIGEEVYVVHEDYKRLPCHFCEGNKKVTLIVNSRVREEKCPVCCGSGKGDYENKVTREVANDMKPLTVKGLTIVVDKEEQEDVISYRLMSKDNERFYAAESDVFATLEEALENIT